MIYKCKLCKEKKDSKKCMPFQNGTSIKLLCSNCFFRLKLYKT